MLTLKDLLNVCKPDWLEIGKHHIHVAAYGIPEGLLNIPVENITGWDDGLTIELCDGSSPCTHLPISLEIQLKAAILRVFSFSKNGSALHIVLDDENVEDHHIQRCIEETIPFVRNKRERAACEKCAFWLLKFPVKEREKIVHGYGREWGIY